MSDILKNLLDSRDAAQKEYEDFVTPLITERRALTDEEAEKRSALKSVVDRIDERIDEVHKEEKRDEKLAKLRRDVTAPVDAQVTKNERMYHEHGEFSYFADFVRASSPVWPGHREAVQRQQRHEYEVAVEMYQGSAEGQRAEAMLREARRTDNGIETRRYLTEMRERGNAGATGHAEYRVGMDTTSGSGGSFVTPQYFVSKYGPYREPGRAFIDQCNKQVMPDYGMTVYVPHVTLGALVGIQPGQNQGISEQELQAGYLSANLTTEAGQVVISQQLLDRAGPNFAFDAMVFDQLHRDYAPKVDILILNTAIAAAASVSSGLNWSSGTFAPISATVANSFYSKIAGGKAAIRTVQGTIMNPTHLFMDPTRWEFMAGTGVDTTGRPVIVPGYGVPFNAAAAGNASGDEGIEGDTGYKWVGLPVFTDHNIPAPSSGNDQAIVGNLSEVYVWEGPLTPRVLPQTYAGNLSVLLQLFAYVTGLVRYPAAIYPIYGTVMAAMTF